MTTQRARAGIAGIEFAVLSPVLLTLLLGTIDLSDALLTARRMEIAAGSVAEIGTTGAAQTAAPNVLTDVQAWQATTAAFALFPYWDTKSVSPSFAVTLSGVSFTAIPAGCTQNCTYTAKVMWSVANELGTPTLRACGPLTSVPNGNPTSYSTLPASNFGPTSLLVADVSYTFQPAFFGFLIGNIPMMQSAYVSPRVNNGITLQAAGGAGVNVNCPATN
jgi:Flp pilus assembly protein TadG